MKTPQEWADFLNKRIACFKVNNKYEYRALNPNVIPFSSQWLQFLEFEKDETATNFYRKYKWQMTKVLATNYYDSLFIITPNGKSKIVQEAGEETRRYIEGRVDTIDKASDSINYEIGVWDKNVYEPRIDETIDKPNNDVKIAEL